MAFFLQRSKGYPNASASPQSQPQPADPRRVYPVASPILGAASSNANLFAGISHSSASLSQQSYPSISTHPTTTANHKGDGSPSTKPQVLTWQSFAGNSNLTNSLPFARTYFSMVSYENNLYIFGGFGDEHGRYDDLQQFNIRTQLWSVLTPTGDRPKGVYLHTSVVYDNCMYVWGGNTGKDTTEIHQLHMPSLTWSRKAPHASAPPSRYGHAAVMCDHRMIIAGGCVNTAYFQDSYSYDMHLNTWQKLGNVPIDLAYHSLWCYCGRVYLFGGYNGLKFNDSMYCLDIVTNQWNPVQVSGTPPPPSCGSAHVVNGRHVWLFGGYTASGHMNRLYRLDMSNLQWEIMETNNPPISRAYLQAALANNIMFIFGGYDGKKCVQDFRSLTLGPPTDVGNSSTSNGLNSTANPKPIVSKSMSPFFQTPTSTTTTTTSAASNNNMFDSSFSFNSGSLTQSNQSNGNSFGNNVNNSSQKTKPLPTSHASSSFDFFDFPTSNGQSSFSTSNQVNETSLQSAPTSEINVYELVTSSKPIPEQVDDILKSFGTTNGDSLIRSELENFLFNLSLNIPAVTPSSSASKNKQAYPFDTSRVKNISALGFDRSHVLRIMMMMYKEGAILSDENAIADRCLREPILPNNSNFVDDDASTGTSQNRVPLTAEEKEDAHACVICYEDRMNTVLLPCKHLSCCVNCAKNLQARKLECPTCRTKIKDIMKIFWT